MSSIAWGGGGGGREGRGRKGRRERIKRGRQWEMIMCAVCMYMHQCGYSFTDCISVCVVYVWWYVCLVHVPVSHVAVCMTPHICNP